MKYQQHHSSKITAAGARLAGGSTAPRRSRQGGDSQVRHPALPALRRAAAPPAPPAPGGTRGGRPAKV
jgi:hypothetical protein